MSRDAAQTGPIAYCVAAFGAVGLAVFAGCDVTTSSQAAPQEPPIPSIAAEVLTVARQSWPRIVRSQGSLLADEATVIGAKVAGRVAAVHVDLGDLVEAGDPLMTLERDEFQLEVQQAEAELTQARSAVGLAVGESAASLDPLQSPPVREERATWDEARASLSRAKRLQAENAISALEFDQIVAAERVAEARYSSAMNSVRERIAVIQVREAELALARQRVEDAVVRASFAGMIQERHVAAGTYLQVGDPVATLVRTSVLRFRGTVPERYAQQLQLGQEVRLKIESVDDTRTVQITRMSPALDLATRSLLFEAEVANDDRQLQTGLFAEAQIVIDPEATALVIPQSAVIEFAGSEKVWRVTDGLAGELEVVTGSRRESGVEVLQGLAAGEVIIRDARQGRVAHVQ